MNESRSPLDRAKEFFRNAQASGKGNDVAKPAGKPRRGQSDKDVPKADDSKKKKPRSLKSEGRESMEAVVVAFILAFLFRTFEAEAFVIPTGSMAPTLLGRNKEAECPQCGQHIVVGASEEIDQETGMLKGERVETAFCPNCRYEVLMRDQPVFTGDRILVTKFSYEMEEPHRFDVIVFKYPQEPQTNYIKRLVGLPGEEIQIRQGDLYMTAMEGGPLKILQKDDPNKQRVLGLLVYDNDHPERGLLEVGWPERWAAVRQTGSEETKPGVAVAGWEDDPDGWVLDEEARSFLLSAKSDGGLKWLRYRNIVPSPDDWAAWEEAKQRNAMAALAPWERLQIITDFCGYNAYSGTMGSHDHGAGYYWVGDLTLNCQVHVEEANQGELLLELNEGPRRYRCRFDLATGEATISYPDARSRDETEIVTLGTAQTSVNGPGTYDLSFANVDNRLCLWVNDELIDFGTDANGRPNAEYPPFGGIGIRQAPNDRDLIPVGIAAKGATVEVSHMKIERDIYYRAEYITYNPEIAMNHRDYQGTSHNEYEGSPGVLLDLLSEPARWYAEYSNNSEPVVSFERLGPGEFFVLGDNSPRSKDSRLWTPDRPGTRGRPRRAARAHAVPRDALVGKAFYIYWPHGKPFLNGGKGFPITYHKNNQGERTDYPSFRFPFYPDFSRMRRIR